MVVNENFHWFVFRFRDWFRKSQASVAASQYMSNLILCKHLWDCFLISSFVVLPPPPHTQWVILSWVKLTCTKVVAIHQEVHIITAMFNMRGVYYNVIRDVFWFHRWGLSSTKSNFTTLFYRLLFANAHRVYGIKQLEGGGISAGNFLHINTHLVHGNYVIIFCLVTHTILLGLTMRWDGRWHLPQKGISLCQLSIVILHTYIT